MNDFWNQRYSSEEFAYGTAPNQFYKEQLEKLESGKILFPGEGEGRNAVFAATLGWQVTAFDTSIEGKKKAELLALKNGVTINYQIDNYESVDFPKNAFDSIVLIYTHIHPLKRKEYHQKFISFLKPGGILILEGFSKKQIKNNTGGPQNVDMLFSDDELRDDFSQFSKLEISETNTLLNEGPFHQGIASVIRIVGIK
jgi:2-polyprenyl-3-methyl-5-hydroxy-6-metoxy-1,4-benzoquinol methylase